MSLHPSFGDILVVRQEGNRHLPDQDRPAPITFLVLQQPQRCYSAELRHIVLHILTCQHFAFGRWACQHVSKSKQTHIFGPFDREAHNVDVGRIAILASSIFGLPIFLLLIYNSPIVTMQSRRSSGAERGRRGGQGKALTLASSHASP